MSHEWLPGVRHEGRSHEWDAPLSREVLVRSPGASGLLRHASFVAASVPVRKPAPGSPGPADRPHTPKKAPHRAVGRLPENGFAYVLAIPPLTLSDPRYLAQMAVTDGEVALPLGLLLIQVMLHFVMDACSDASRSRPETAAPDDPPTAVEPPVHAPEVTVPVAP